MFGSITMETPFDRLAKLYAKLFWLHDQDGHVTHIW